jgi:hypothetical protein
MGKLHIARIIEQSNGEQPELISIKHSRTYTASKSCQMYYFAANADKIYTFIFLREHYG